MMASDEDDTNRTNLTILDKSRLEDLQIGEYFDGELGNWRILRYKDSYNVMLFNSKIKQEFSSYQNVEEVIKFLNT